MLSVRRYTPLVNRGWWLSPALPKFLRVADAENQTGLEAFIRQVLDRLGMSRPDRGVSDKSLAKAKLAADALNWFLKTIGVDLSVSVGVAAVSTTASVTATLTGIAHNLKDGNGNVKTPIGIVTTDQSDAGGITNTTVASITSSTFSIGLRFTDGTARTTTHNVFWVAIG